MIVAQISMNRVTSISTSLRASEKELKATYRFRAYWALGPTHLTEVGIRFLVCVLALEPRAHTFEGELHLREERVA